MGRKRSNSLSESTTSADESDNSVGDEISSSSLSGTSSPATSAHEFNPAAHNESDDYAALKSYDPSHGTSLPVVGRHPSSEWIDLMTLRYIQANGNYPPHHQPLFYPPMPSNYDAVSFKQSPPPFIQPSAIDLVRSYEQMPSPDFSPLAPAILDQPKKSMAASPPKKSSFSISAILGCESWTISLLFVLVQNSNKQMTIFNWLNFIVLIFLNCTFFYKKKSWLVWFFLMIFLVLFYMMFFDLIHIFPFFIFSCNTFRNRHISFLLYRHKWFFYSVEIANS